jgi:hypothetical protein
MINFQDFIAEEKEPLELSEADIDSMVDNLRWEDIQDLYDDEDFDEDLQEGISAVERIRRAQRFKARKMLLALQRKIKLKRMSAMPVLKRRAQVAARKLITNRLLKNRTKQQLSPSEKNMIELRTKRILKVYKNLPMRLIPKIREIERTRLS